MSPEDPSRERRIDEAVAEYLELDEAGRAPEPAEFASRYPEFADELLAFLADRRRLAEFLGPSPPGDETLPPSGPAPGPLGIVRYLGDYELLEEVARGGMGVVYRARQTSLRRTVAVKMILAGQLANDRDVQRFRAEAEAAARLDHPGIVPIYETGTHEGMHYFAMAYVEGESLAHRLARGVFPARAAADLVRRVAEAVAYAHVEGVVHRDLKPGNILIDRDGRPRVTDFGLAKRVRPEEGETEAALTATGDVLGTPSYMPPEQASGNARQIGPPADVYSLGAILYALLTGRPPFQAATTLDTLLQVVGTEPVAPTRLNPGVPRDLETICLKCLEKEPARRYGSAQELVDELQRFLDGEPIRARPVGRIEHGWRWCRRNPAVSGLAAGVLVSILAGASVSALLAVEASRRARDAQHQAMQAAASEAKARDARERADQEAVKAQALLARGKYEQAQALGRTNQPGKREAGLGLLREAEALCARLRRDNASPSGLPLPTRAELRSEAVALLTADDIRTGRTFNLGTVGQLPAVSPDGKFAAATWMDVDLGRLKNGDPTGSRCGVEVVDLAGEKPPVRWERPITGLTDSAVGISPDNRLVAVGNHLLEGDRVRGIAVELRDQETGKLVRSLPWPRPDGTPITDAIGVALIRFSADGRHLAASRTGVKGVEFALWELETGKSRLLSRDNNPAGTWVVFSPDSKRLAYPSGERSVGLWDIDRQGQADSVELPLPVAGSPAFDTAGRLLAVPCRGKGEARTTVLVWDLAGDEQRCRFEVRGAGVEGGGVSAVAFRPGTTTLGAADGADLMLVDAGSGREVLRCDSGHRMGVAMLAWGGDGGRLVTAGLDATVKTWAVAEPPPVTTLRQPFAAGKELVFSPDGRWLATAPRDSTRVVLIDRRRGGRTATLVPAKQGGGMGLITQVAFSPDGKKVAAITLDVPGSRVFLWDVPTGKELLCLEVKKRTQRIAFGADGGLLGVWADGDSLVVWDVGKDRQVWRGEGGTGTMATLSGDARFVVTLSSPGFGPFTQVAVIELATDHRWGPWRVDGMATQSALGPAGDLLALAHVGLDIRKGKGSEPGLTVFKLPEGKRLLGLGVTATSLTFSPDGRLLAMAADGSLVLTDVRTGEEVLRWAGDVRDLAFDAGGGSLAFRRGGPTPGGGGIQVLDLVRLRSRLGEIGLDW